MNFDISLVGFTAIYDGPGIDPEEAQARQQRLEDELKKKADEARQQLLQLQQQHDEHARSSGALASRQPAFECRHAGLDRAIHSVRRRDRDRDGMDRRVKPGNDDNPDGDALTVESALQFGAPRLR